MAFQAAPLNNAFNVIAMMGFLASAIFWSSGRLSETWGFTFCMIFTFMFIASVISMTHAPVPEELQIDMKRRRKKVE